MNNQGVSKRPAPATSVGQIRANVCRFSRDCHTFGSLARQLVRQATYWIYDTDASAFAPAKFAGFDQMTFAIYTDRKEAYKGSGGFDAVAARGAVTGVLGEQYRSDDWLADRLVIWADDALGPATARGVDRGKWRFVCLAQQRNYWAACVNPRLFDIDGALDKLTTDTWRVKKSKVAAGDLFLLWRCLKDGKRGVVGLGEVSSDPKEMRPSQEGREFMLDDSLDTVERRVWVRLHRPPNAPIWLEDDGTGLLAGLSVAKARGGTIFKVTPRQWHEIVELLGGWEESEGAEAEEALRQAERVLHKGRRQGFKVSPKARRAIELRAMQRAEGYFLGQGYSVVDVSRNHPFDLKCTRDGEELHVEVKGTTTPGEDVLLTPNEVAHAKENAAKMVLFILHSVQVSESEDGVNASGGTVVIKRPWKIEAQGTLKPVGFSYKLR